jgi:chromosome segregation ATPase
MNNLKDFVVGVQAGVYAMGGDAAHIENLKDIIRRYEDDEVKLCSELDAIRESNAKILSEKSEEIKSLNLAIQDRNNEIMWLADEVSDLKNTLNRHNNTIDQQGARLLYLDSDIRDLRKKYSEYQDEREVLTSRIGEAISAAKIRRGAMTDHNDWNFIIKILKGEISE